MCAKSDKSIDKLKRSLPFKNREGGDKWRSLESFREEKCFGRDESVMTEKHLQKPKTRWDFKVALVYLDFIEAYQGLGANYFNVYGHYFRILTSETCKQTDPSKPQENLSWHHPDKSNLLPRCFLFPWFYWQSAQWPRTTVFRSVLCPRFLVKIALILSKILERFAQITFLGQMTLLTKISHFKGEFSS